ncbi:MAG: tRNA pseudouridine(55) synthase TruB [Thermoleophilia bacterium]
MPEAPTAGLLLVDKPAGISSFGAIARLRRAYGRKLGHTGTLDPFATGLLVVLHGRATRLAPYLGGLDKRYEATVQFGATSTTDDPEGHISTTGETTTEAAVAAALPAFIGEIQQVPPAASAVHIDGERAYRRFRRGETVTVPARQVTVHGIRLMHFDDTTQTAQLDVACGTGTYVRSIARDLGEVLGTGAYLTALRRTEVGDFRVDDAAAPDAIAESVPGTVAWAAPLTAIPALPRREVTATERTAIGHGQRIANEELSGDVALVMDDALVAIGAADGAEIAPRLVLEPA